MRILHISNDYSGSTVYKNMFNCLNKYDLEQYVYHPFRKGKFRHDFEIENNIYVNEREVLNFYSRVNFFYKKRIILSDILKEIKNLNDFNLIHAHTWYSDGSVAYELFKLFNIPYVITIRNSDINFFYKYIFYQRTYGMRILNNAARIIFISPKHYKRLFESHFFKKRYDSSKKKFHIIPNGIDDFWIENMKKFENRNLDNPIKLLFVGKLTRNKNLVRLVESIKIIDSFKYELTVIGEGSKKIIKYLSNSQDVNYQGAIRDKEKLKKIYNKSQIFVMPSLTETFGLVYLEALSQGIPILYTLNEGVDGYFEDKIGEGVDPKSIISIAAGIENISRKYKEYHLDQKIITETFNWNSIAKKYYNLYFEECI